MRAPRSYTDFGPYEERKTKKKREDTYASRSRDPISNKCRHAPAACPREHGGFAYLEEAATAYAASVEDDPIMFPLFHSPLLDLRLRRGKKTVSDFIPVLYSKLNGGSS